MKFINEDFLLQCKTASGLYHEFAEEMPILDYHNHLPPKEIAENRQFNNLVEIWLEGDHYKWRALRANGVAERNITGDGDPFDKFMAWAKTVPQTLRNPLYHWTHLELSRYFGIDDLLNEKSAPSIWEQANAQLQTEAFRTHGILKKFQVAALCTTDDPADDLTYHKAIAASGLATRVYPAFRPDKALAVDKPAAFGVWIKKLSAVSNVSIESLPDLLEAIDLRHQAFDAVGCRLSDHGLNTCYADFPDDRTAADIFNRALEGAAATADEHGKFAAYMMLVFGRLDAKRGWTKQLHLGALRSANTRAFQTLGPDTGFDSIADYSQVRPLAAYLDRLDQENSLPKMVLYNCNPVDNYAFSAMIANFQDGSIPGKMQFGSGWWFLDTKEGIEMQLNALSNNGLLARFVGMLTDSRSFMSYPRHEYFRRVLCNMFGSEIERGEIPNDKELVGSMIQNICYHNANAYLALDIPTTAKR
jgi:glucuronate isomerase